MSIYTRKRCSLQGQYNVAGQKHDSDYSQAEHGDVPGRGGGGVNWPFPSKPVRHRRPLSPRAQDLLDLYDFQKCSISKQSKGPLLLHEHHSNDIREIPGSHHSRKDSQRLASGEMHMARAIHAKELMLKEKLWRVEGKIRLKIQRDSVAAGDDQKREEYHHNRRQTEREKAQTKSRLTEQHWREPVKTREDLMQKRRQEDVKQLRKEQSQRDEERIRNTHEEGGRWKKREVEFTKSPQSNIKVNRGTYDITINKQNVRELDELRWQNVKKHRREQGDEKDHRNLEETVVRPHDEIEKPRELNTGWTTGNKYIERKEMYGLGKLQDMPQMSQHKTAHRLATENQRGAERKIFEELTLPPVASPFYSSRPQLGELGQDSTDISFHLLPCRICKRKFASGRLEKHAEICKKVNRSHRQVFNSYVNRTKGSAIEEFWKTHSRSKTPEDLHIKNQRHTHKAYTKNRLQSQIPAATSK